MKNSVEFYSWKIRRKKGKKYLNVSLFYTLMYDDIYNYRMINNYINNYWML